MARWLDERGHSWEYEKHVFSVDTGKYIPDFWIKDFGCFWEVKGYFRPDAKLKVESFRQRNIAPLVVIDETTMKSIGLVTQ